MSSPTRRGGIPGPESRTGLTRPSMTEAEFERGLALSRVGPRPRQQQRWGMIRSRGFPPLRPTQRLGRP